MAISTLCEAGLVGFEGESKEAKSRLDAAWATSTGWPLTVRVKRGECSDKGELVGRIRQR